jgi:hypothetical protein
MSQVRNALRMAGTWPQETENSAAQAHHGNGYPSAIAMKVDAAPEVESEFGESSQPDQPAPQPTLMARVVRRVRRWMGLRVSGPVPRCTGMTRRGLPCRAPAMANGLCRMHGGAPRRPLHQRFSRPRFSEAVEQQ